MKTVETSLKILTWLTHQRGDFGVSDISREFDIDKATISRHLQVLVKAGFVDRDARSRRYRPGFALVELGNTVLANLRLLDLARPLMSGLWQRTGESIQLSILRGMRGALYIHRLESQEGVQYTSRLGSYGPLHCTAAGKAMLAFLPEDSVSKVLGEPLEQCTSHTITDHDILLNELQLIRERGYAVDDQGFREHLTSVAAPIFAADHLPVAAIGIGGPSQRFNKRRIRQFSSSLLIATQQLSQDMQNQPMPEALLP